MTTAIAPPQSVSCERCGLSTTVPKLLTRVRRSFKSSAQTGPLLCPYCASRSRNTKVAVIWALNLLGAAMLFGIWIARVARGHQPRDEFDWIFGFTLAV